MIADVSLNFKIKRLESEILHLKAQMNETGLNEGILKIGNLHLEIMKRNHELLERYNQLVKIES